MHETGQRTETINHGKFGKTQINTGTYMECCKCGHKEIYTPIPETVRA